ncbi:methylmalonyl-CoA epimerase, mitochondrial [Sphaerodactylus townsendi]|uniref:methylmalonyl-CoA epimerase, mitochondrial n=1 Tax=Sphaerodactylus townsendi TaxID=933632 RepID=UPI00202653CB|nr:methylmalonyl-CoA epimerase, mitochondrial [Sphaerodactylus townsendi]
MAACIRTLATGMCVSPGARQKSATLESSSVPLATNYPGAWEHRGAADTFSASCQVLLGRGSGQWSENTKLELLHPLGDDSPVANFLQKNKAGGLHHLFKVDNITDAIADLKKKQIRLLSEGAKIGAHGKPVIFLHPKDCGGVLVELKEA